MSPLNCERKIFDDARDAEVACAAWAGRGGATEHVVIYYCPECAGYHWGNAFGSTSKRQWKALKAIGKANKKWGVLVGSVEPSAIPQVAETDPPA